MVKSKTKIPKGPKNLEETIFFYFQHKRTFYLNDFSETNIFQSKVKNPGTRRIKHDTLKQLYPLYKYRLPFQNREKQYGIIISENTNLLFKFVWFT